MLAKSTHADVRQALTSLAGGDGMCDTEDLGKVSNNTKHVSVSTEGTHAASTYDRIVPTRFSYNDNACKKPRSYSKDAKYSARGHGRDDHLIGGMA